VEADTVAGDEVWQVFEARLPQEEIDRLCQSSGVIARQRKLRLGMLVRALVISAGTPGGAYQASVPSHMLGRSGSIWRGACVVVKDWCIIAATTGKVRDAVRDEFPGRGDDAAIKVHTVLSGGCGAPVQSHFSPATVHDRRQLTRDESWRGCGLLAALYRVRWGVKLSLRVDKSVHRLDSIDANRPCPLKALPHASPVAQWERLVAKLAKSRALHGSTLDHYFHLEQQAELHQRRVASRELNGVAFPRDFISQVFPART
jgi:hypothetical protein